MAVATSIWQTISEEAAHESALWEAALRPAEAREAVPVFSPLNEERYALGLESIYEGYLLHYGQPRLFDPPDRDTTVLLGDYLYAHGLVRIAELGDVSVVGDLAELLSVCAHLRAERSPGDGVAWASAVALLGSWRETDGAAWLDQAQRTAGPQAVERALALHGERVT
jgi:hypothetical protein